MTYQIPPFNVPVHNYPTNNQLPPPIGGTVVSPAFNMVRSGLLDISNVLNDARTISTDVINDVGSMLSWISGAGGGAFDDAQLAIQTLGQFHPVALNITYDIPGFTGPGFTTAGMPTLPTPEGTDPISTGAITTPFTPVSPPPIGGHAPTLTPVTFRTASTPKSMVEPIAPGDTSVTVPLPGDFGELGDFTLGAPNAPTLRELVLPPFTPPPLPDYTFPTLQAQPTLPIIDVMVEFKDYVLTFDLSGAPEAGSVLIGPDVTAREISGGTKTFDVRGAELPDDVRTAQTQFFTEEAGLLNADERRQQEIATSLWDLEVTRLTLSAAVKSQELLTTTALEIGKFRFEAGVLEAQSLIQLYGSYVALYNARLAYFSALIELYKADLETKVAGIEYWKAEVQAEIAKTKANAQTARIYAETQQVRVVGAEVYAAQVQAVVAVYEKYRADISAITSQSEVARTQLGIFGATVNAYVAGLSAYKAQFQIYSDQTRGIIARNSGLESQLRIQMADMARAGTEAAYAATTVEVNAESLKVAAQKYATSFEENKLTNAIEATKASIAGDQGRVNALRAAIEAHYPSAINTAVGAFANQAVRYYAAASDSAFRASEQALKALTSSTQAGAIAQEAAGRAAASVSQGAFSALHISAGMHGAGKVAGAEDSSARAQQHFSDMLNFSETKEQTASI